MVFNEDIINSEKEPVEKNDKQWEESTILLIKTYTRLLKTFSSQFSYYK
jgi:hypothetical protein